MDGSVTRLYPWRSPEAPASPACVVLSGWQRMEVETARMLLMELPRPAAELGPPRMAYLAGRLEGVAANLLDIIDAITAPGEGS